MSRTTALLLGAAILVLGVIAFFLLSGGERAPAASPAASPSPTATVEPSPTVALNQDLLTHRFTVLLVGLDLNEERRAPGVAGNTDALMLASVSADQSEVVLVSLPRDTVDVPLADGTTWSPKINGLFAERGIDELVGAMETLYGVPIDGYVMIHMDDFGTLVDAVGEVTVNPPDPLFDPDIGLDLQPGEQELDGRTALSYVRTRIDQDYGRMGRQQEVITDLVSRLVDPATEIGGGQFGRGPWMDLDELLDGLDSLETDLPLDDLRTLVEIARRARDATVERVLVQPPDMIVQEGDLGDGRGYVLVPDIQAIRNAVIALIPPEE